ncbi:MAG: hypothetical protein NW201_07670, partial [Gemmatimonadales bacterium]|nr:hypothetical protein [Gemmatimonadales bacterium]
MLLARAWERQPDAPARDSAAAAWRAAATALPTIADWLRLRAIRLTADSAARAALIAELQGTVARDRAP